MACERKSYAFAGNTMTVVTSGQETEGRFALVHVIKPGGSSTPVHSHDEETELCYVLSGSVGVETEGHITKYGAGDLAILPPGRPHRLFNESGETTRELILCAPPLFDQFVATAGYEVEPGAVPAGMTAEDRQRLVENAARFGIRLLPSAAQNGEAQETPKQSFELLEVLGTQVEVVARLGTSDDDLVLLRQTIQPGGSIPLHSHPEPEGVFVEHGEIELYREPDGWTNICLDQAAYVGSGVRHAVRNSGERSAVLLVVATVRMARFLAAIAKPAMTVKPSPPDELDVQSLSDQFEAFGYWLASPDEIVAVNDETAAKSLSS